jgi:hypothetical protein
MVDFDEVCFDAVSKVSIHFLNVEMQFAVVNLVDVSSFLPEHMEESEDFLEIAVSRTFRRSTPQQ